VDAPVTKEQPQPQAAAAETKPVIEAPQQVAAQSPVEEAPVAPKVEAPAQSPVASPAQETPQATPAAVEPVASQVAETPAPTTPAPTVAPTTEAAPATAAASETAAPESGESELIEARGEQLRGLRVVGKIELPSDKVKKKDPVASSDTAADKNAVEKEKESAMELSFPTRPGQARLPHPALRLLQEMPTQLPEPQTGLATDLPERQDPRRHQPQQPSKVPTGPAQIIAEPVLVPTAEVVKGRKYPIKR
jgi:hypothetical protein